MWQQIFNPENLFFRILARGVDLVGLSLLWILLCMPVITIGPASAALYYTVVKVFRHKKEEAFKTYLKAFWSNLKQGILLTVICIPIGIFLAWGSDVMINNTATEAGVIMYMIYYVLLVVPAGICCYIFPLMGRFEFKTPALIQTAVIMTFRHLPSTVIVVMLTIEMVVFTIERWWPVLFTPVLTAILASLFLERIFPKYLSGEELAAFMDAEETEE